MPCLRKTRDLRRPFVFRKESVPLTYFFEVIHSMMVDQSSRSQPIGQSFSECKQYVNFGMIIRNPKVRETSRTSPAGSFQDDPESPMKNVVLEGRGGHPPFNAEFDFGDTPNTSVGPGTPPEIETSAARRSFLFDPCPISRGDVEGPPPIPGDGTHNPCPTTGRARRACSPGEGRPPSHPAQAEPQRREAERSSDGR